MKTRENEVAFQGDQSFHCLKGKTVMTAEISDHYPIVHNDVLFWNVMMQGKARGNDYNNGFGIVESVAEYRNRLQRIAYVIDEICLIHQNIKVISLCEGPINGMEEKFYGMISQMPAIKDRFSQSGFLKPEDTAMQWGLLNLVDKNYSVKKSDKLNQVIAKKNLNELKNRAELLELKHINETHVAYVALFHLPFGVISKHISSQFATELSHLSPLGKSVYKLVKQLIRHYDNEDLTISGDFNFRPHLLEAKQNGLGYAIPEKNSQLFLKGEAQAVTVDGILVSQKNRQRIVGSMITFGLFGQLKREYDLGNKAEKVNICQKIF